MNYRFQLGSNNFQSERHELDASADFGKLSVAAIYLYARKLERTDIQDSRQQIYGASNYEFDENWSLSTNARYDLSKEEQGLRYAGLGVNYTGQCFSVLTSLRRSYADKETGDNATEFLIQLGLKNIGTFGTNQ